MLAQPQQRKPPQLVGFLARDGFDRQPADSGRPSLHLADDKGAALARDDVDLTFRASPVAFDDLQPGLAQMPDGDVLAVAPDRVLGPHVTTSGSEDVSLPWLVGLRRAPPWTARCSTAVWTKSGCRPRHQACPALRAR